MTGEQTSKLRQPFVADGYWHSQCDETEPLIDTSLNTKDSSREQMFRCLTNRSKHWHPYIGLIELAEGLNHCGETEPLVKHLKTSNKKTKLYKCLDASVR